MEKKIGKLRLAINSIEQADDPTVLPISFVIADDQVSGNNVIIDDEAFLELANSIINKPIVAEYFNDDFTDHAYSMTQDRDGNNIIQSDTTPIGVFTENGEIEVLADGTKVINAKGHLWKTRFNNAVGLIEEWFADGIEISSSNEYLYYNYSMKDGVEIHHSPMSFEGMCILGKDVLPAYEKSKVTSLDNVQLNQFNRAVANVLNEEQKEMFKTKEENESMEMFRKVNELSHSDIRSKLYTVLDTFLEKGVASYITDVYDSKLIVNEYKWSEDDTLEYDKYYSYNYTTDESEVITIDQASKVEVFSKRNWEEVVPVEVQTQLNEKDDQIETLTGEIKEAQTQVNALTTEKVELEGKYSDSVEKLTALNAQVEALAPFKEQVDAERQANELAEKQEFYEAKFIALNAKAKFDSEEVQALVTETAKGSSDAIMQLNTMLVELVTVKAPDVPMRETSSVRENLIPVSNSFASRYGA